MNSLVKLLLSPVLLVTALSASAESNDDFLGQRIDYQPAVKGHDAQVYRAPGFSPEKLGQYSSFIVEPVVLFYSDQSAYKGIFPDELKAIADYTRQRIEQALSQDGLTLAQSPGPGVLRFRIAITNMKRHKPLKFLDFTPIGAVVFGVEAAAGANTPTPEKVAKGHSYVMSATIEGGVFDSQSGALLGAYKDKAKTRPKKDKQEIDPQKGATWGQVKEAIDYWADLLAEHVKNAKAAASKPARPSAPTVTIQ